MQELPFAGDGCGDGQWRAFPFDTPELFLRFELTSHTIKSAMFGGALKKWKVRYNIHEYKHAPMASLARAVLATNRLNGGAPAAGQSDVRDAPELAETEELRRKLRRTKAMISFKTNSNHMPCFDIMHSGVSVKFPPEKKKVRPSSFYKQARVELLPARSRVAHTRAVVWPLVEIGSRRND
jgi:hypothetical protein